MRVLDVCVKKGCPKHRPPRKTQTARAGKSKAAVEKAYKREDDRRHKEQEAQRAWDQIRPQVLKAFVAHVKGQKVTPDLVSLAFGYERAEVVKLTGTLTVANMGQALAVHVGRRSAWNRANFIKEMKRFKFDVAAAEKKLRAVAKKKVPAKKTAKKRPARKAKKR